MKFHSKWWDAYRERKDRERVQQILQTNDQKVLAELDKRFHDELARLLEVAPSTWPTPVDMESVTRAMAEVIKAREAEPKRIIVIHPDLPDRWKIEAVGKELGIEIIEGNRAMLKPGEAFIMYDPRQVGDWTL